MKTGARAFVLLALLGAAGCNDDDGSGAAQPSLIKEGDVIVATHLDVARLAAVTRIEGSLVIRPTEDLTDVTLPRLERVLGSLSVQDLPMRGHAFSVTMGALSQVGENVEILRSDTETDVTLPVLRTVGAHLRVEQAGRVSVHAPLLNDLNGDLRLLDGGVAVVELPALARIGGSLRIERFQPRTDDATAAATFTLSLPALASLEGDIKLRSSLALDIVAPLLVTIGGDVQVSGLRLALHFAALTTLTGDLRGSQAVLLASDLGKLSDIGGAFSLDGVTFEPVGSLALPALGHVGQAFEINEAGGLGDLALPALARVGGHLRLSSDGDLGHLSIPGPVELPSDFEVSGCGATVNVDAPLVAKVGGSLLFTDDGDLGVSLPALAEVVGTVRVARATVRKLDLPALATVSQHVELDAIGSNNFPMVNLPALATLGGNLLFGDSHGVRALMLPLLASVGGVYGGHPLGSVTITGNDNLVDIIVPALRKVTLDLIVRDNPTVNSLAVQTATAAVTLGGLRTVCGNLGGLPACM